LRTVTSHSGTTIVHLYELSISNWPIGFALETESFHFTHRLSSSPLIHDFSRLRNNFNFWAISNALGYPRRMKIQFF
jgi:hypothetical protein